MRGRRELLDLPVVIIVMIHSWSGIAKVRDEVRDPSSLRFSEAGKVSFSGGPAQWEEETNGRALITIVLTSSISFVEPFPTAV